MCLDSAKPLIRICNCSGTIRYVHYGCAGEWICRQLDDNAVDDFDNCEIPHCELCDAEFAAYLTLEEEEIDGDHFAEFYSKKDWSHRLYLLFLTVGIFFSLYTLVVGVLAWGRAPHASFTHLFWTHFTFPLWFVGHAGYMFYQDSKEINKLRKREIYVELKPE